ncbi:MAG: cytochrome c [Verrucomicrobiota bacterium]|nr:cytochrome c [Limisphaera sp.]MDW8382629.1 cytochrome c [Verrucomicrobiota bacterium]
MSKSREALNGWFPKNVEGIREDSQALTSAQRTVPERRAREQKVREAVHLRKTVERGCIMKRTWALVGIVVAGVASNGIAAEAKIKELYEKECAKCHGSDGKGDTKMGKKLGAKDYTDPKVQAQVTDEAAFKAIKEGLKDRDGKTLMKPLEGVSDEDIKALVAYMRTFAKK